MNPVSITPKALEEIKNIMKNKNIPQGYGLRVMVQGGGGCGGAQYRLGFDKLKEGDSSYFVDQVPVYYEKRQMMYLLGMEIDFEERVDERGFVFNRTEINKN